MGGRAGGPKRGSVGPPGAPSQSLKCGERWLSSHPAGCHPHPGSRLVPSAVPAAQLISSLPAASSLGTPGRAATRRVPVASGRSRGLSRRRHPHRPGTRTYAHHRHLIPTQRIPQAPQARAPGKVGTGAARTGRSARSGYLLRLPSPPPERGSGPAQQGSARSRGTAEAAGRCHRGRSRLEKSVLPPHPPTSSLCAKRVRVPFIAFSAFLLDLGLGLSSSWQNTLGRLHEKWVEERTYRS